MLIYFATLLTLADGLNRLGVVAWVSAGVSGLLVGYPPLLVMAALVAFFFLVHYLFASLTAHATAVLPALLAVGLAIPGMPVRTFVLLLAYALGLMGVIAPVRHRAGLRLLWQRLHRAEGFLAAGVHLRPHLPRRAAGGRDALPALDGGGACGAAERRRCRAEPVMGDDDGIRDPAIVLALGSADGACLPGPAGHRLRAGLCGAGGRALGPIRPAQLYRDVHGGRGRLHPLVLPALPARCGLRQADGDERGGRGDRRR